MLPTRLPTSWARLLDHSSAPCFIEELLRGHTVWGMPLLPGMSQQPLAVHMEPVPMEKWKSWDGEVCLGEPTRSFLLQMPDNPKYLSVSDLSVVPYKVSCSQEFVSHLREVPLKSLSNLCTLYLGEHKSVKKFLYLPSSVTHILI